MTLVERESQLKLICKMCLDPVEAANWARIAYELLKEIEAVHKVESGKGSDLHKEMINELFRQKWVNVNRLRNHLISDAKRSA